MTSVRLRPPPLRPAPLPPNQFPSKSRSSPPPLLYLVYTETLHRTALGYLSNHLVRPHSVRRKGFCTPPDCSVDHPRPIPPTSELGRVHRTASLIRISSGGPYSFPRSASTRGCDRWGQRFSLMGCSPRRPHARHDHATKIKPPATVQSLVRSDRSVSTVETKEQKRLYINWVAKKKITDV
ncbi:unnamed protein product, partial [Iphiclides podalirius]